MPKKKSRVKKLISLSQRDSEWLDGFAAREQVTRSGAIALMIRRARDASRRSIYAKVLA